MPPCFRAEGAADYSHPALPKSSFGNRAIGEPKDETVYLAWSHPRFARIEIDLPRANSGMAEA
jgi:hypothetical protein